MDRHYLDAVRLLARTLLLCLPQPLDECHRLALETAREATASTAADHLHEFLMAKVKEFIEFHTTELELFEGPLLLHRCDLLGRGHDC